MTIPFYALGQVTSLMMQLIEVENHRRTAQFFIDLYNERYKLDPKPDDFEGFKYQAMRIFCAQDEESLIAALENSDKLKANIERPVAALKEALLKYGIEVDCAAVYA